MSLSQLEGVDIAASPEWFGSGLSAHLVVGRIVIVDGAHAADPDAAVDQAAACIPPSPPITACTSTSITPPLPWSGPPGSTPDREWPGRPQGSGTSGCPVWTGSVLSAGPGRA